MFLRHDRDQFTPMAPGTEIVVVRFYRHYRAPNMTYEFLGADVVQPGDKLSFPLRLAWHFTGIPWVALGGNVTSIGAGVVAFTNDHWPAGDAFLGPDDNVHWSPDEGYIDPLPAGANLAFFPSAFEMDTLFAWPLAGPDGVLEKNCAGFIRTVARSRLRQDQKVMVLRQALAVAQHIYPPPAQAGATYAEMVSQYAEIASQLEQALRDLDSNSP